MHQTQCNARSPIVGTKSSECMSFVNSYSCLFMNILSMLCFIHAPMPHPPWTLFPMFAFFVFRVWHRPVTLCNVSVLPGVLNMGPEARHVLQLEVMPLTGGFLPLPTVRLSRYIPANKGMYS